MTQQEFNAAQAAARENYLILQQRAARELHDLYVAAADEVAAVIKELEANGRGTGLTAASKRELEKALRKTAKDLTSGIEPGIINTIQEQTDLLSESHIKFIQDGLSLSGMATDVISGEVIASMYSGLNQTLIETTYNRLFNGYTFKYRLSLLRSNWAADVDNVIVSGFMQNRDVIDIAVDLQKYARGGKAGLVRRYGKLERGTKTFMKRIPKNLDYRALRLARSELYISLQDAAKLQGRLNPAVRKYNWNLTAGSEHICICPDLAADSPYVYNEVPNYPHSNCYKEGTEVYTKRGWIDFRNVKNDDLFLSLNPQNMNYEWVKSVAKQKIKVNDELVIIKSKWFELATTKNHRNYVKAGGTYKWLSSQAIHEMPYSYIAIPRTGEWIGENTKYAKLGNYEIPIELYLKFMAYYISDGHVSNNSKGFAYHGIIARARNKNKEKIFSELKELPFKIFMTKTGFTFYDYSVCSELFKMGKSVVREIPEFIKKMSSDLIKIFLNAYSLCDGYISEIDTEFKNIKSNNITFFTSSKKLSDDIGELIIKAGGHPSYNVQAPREIQFRNGVYKSKYDCYRISWNKSKSAYKHKDAPEKGLKTELIKYSGYVYDVTLEKNHILWIKYNGKTCFSGNCLCYITLVMIGRDEFVNDLIDFGRGLNVPYLDDYMRNVYLPFVTSRR
jgi:intein/homing endonuclease